jgi:hypothetical protein
LELGGAPKLVGHPQKIFVRVASWTCTSSPITGSYLAIKSGAMLAGIGFFHYSGAVPPIHPKFSFSKDQSYVTLLPAYPKKLYRNRSPTSRYRREASGCLEKPQQPGITLWLATLPDRFSVGLYGGA